MDKIEVIKVPKPGIEFFRNVKNSIGLMFGMIMLVAGVLMTLSIVLIIPGLLGILVGAVFTYMNAPKSEVICRACETVNRAAPPNKRMECEACGTITPIKWISRRKYNQRKKA